MGCMNSKILIDHKDRDGLNNTRQNLRQATHAQNQRNTAKSKNKSSKFKGVTWSKRANKWQAALRCDGKTFRLGTYKDEKEAAMAYDKKARDLFKEFARLNFPDETNKL